MKMFLAGLLTGGVIGGALGVAMICLVTAGKWADEEMEQRALFSDLFQRLFGNPVKWDHYRGYSAIDLARHLPESDKQKVDIYVDCGDDDFLYKGNDALHTALRDSRIRSEYRMRDGGHTWEYWRTGLPEILRRCTSSSNR